MYDNDDYDLAGFSVGAAERGQLLPRGDILAGDVVIAEEGEALTLTSSEAAREYDVSTTSANGLTGFADRVIAGGAGSSFTLVVTNDGNVDLDNVSVFDDVDDRLTVDAPEPEPAAVMYTVVSGDTLSGIAKAQYGNAMKYMTIFDANKPMLEDPDKIYPGQVLRIPPLAD